MTYLICEAIGQAREPSDHYQGFIVVSANKPRCHCQSLLVKRVTPPGANGKHAFAEPYEVLRLSVVLCFTPSTKLCFFRAHRPRPTCTKQGNSVTNPGPVQTLSQ